MPRSKNARADARVPQSFTLFRASTWRSIKHPTNWCSWNVSCVAYCSMYLRWRSLPHQVICFESVLIALCNCVWIRHAFVWCHSLNIFQTTPLVTLSTPHLLQTKQCSGILDMNGLERCYSRHRIEIYDTACSVSCLAQPLANIVSSAFLNPQEMDLYANNSLSSSADHSWPLDWSPTIVKLPGTCNIRFPFATAS